MAYIQLQIVELERSSQQSSLNFTACAMRMNAPSIGRGPLPASGYHTNWHLVSYDMCHNVCHCGIGWLEVTNNEWCMSYFQILCCRLCARLSLIALDGSVVTQGSDLCVTLSTVNRGSYPLLESKKCYL